MPKSVQQAAEELGNEPEPVASDPQVGVEALAKAITQAIGQTGPRRFIPFGQQSLVSEFNPKGLRNRKLARTVYQNGNRINVDLVYDVEIELLDAIKPGRYIENLVRIVEGEDQDGTTAIHILYHNKTADQRMALGGKLKGEGKTGLERMLRMILAEEAAQIAAKKAIRKREVEEALNS